MRDETGGYRLDLQSLTKAALIFLAAFALYFGFRSPGLDDFDSVNFAMGVREFNIWVHQPHPPGYPLFILLGWIGVKVFGSSPESSLHFVSGLGGAFFIAAWFLIIKLQFTERLAWWIASCLTITPAIWMAATKVLSDTLAAGFLSAEIFAALWFLQRQRLAALLSASLFGAAAAGTRPQLVLVVIVILVIALKQGRACWKMSILGASTLIAGCLVWLLPMCYLQSRLRPDVPIWFVYPKLLYGQWRWILNKPGLYLGTGDWSLQYIGRRFGAHFLGWFGLGFGFLQSVTALVAGIVIATCGLAAYLSWHREKEDQQFWKFHCPWAFTHIAVIFISLWATQRYYLIIFPLLLIALLRGFLRLRVPLNWMALAVPCLLLYILMPIAIANHRDEAPPVRMVRYLAKLYPPASRKSVALLFVNARRHAEWYAPEFVTFADVPPARDLPHLLASATAVYTDDEKVPLPAGWKRVPVAIFSRSPIIYMKYHVVQLFLVDRGNRS